MCNTPLVAAPEWAAGVPSFCPVCVSAQDAIERDQVLRGETSASLVRSKQTQIERYLADSCIGARFQGMRFADYHPVNDQAAAVLESCRQFAAGFTPGSGTSMIFVGSTGTGKNMLSAIIGQEIIQRGHSFLHTTALKVVRRFKDSWSQPAVTEDSVLKYFVSPDVLVIDEVGVQFGSAAEQMYLTEVINDRYEAMKSTILLSNLTLPQIGENIGARAVERFHENGGRVLIFAWPSFRRRAV
jgi:DNA replication protein DnaC